MRPIIPHIQPVLFLFGGVVKDRSSSRVFGARVLCLESHWVLRHWLKVGDRVPGRQGPGYPVEEARGKWCWRLEVQSPFSRPFVFFWFSVSPLKTNMAMENDPDWRCISYWTWGYFIAKLVYQRVCVCVCVCVVVLFGEGNDCFLVLNEVFMSIYLSYVVKSRVDKSGQRPFQRLVFLYIFPVWRHCLEDFSFLGKEKAFFKFRREETPPTFSMWRNRWMILKDSILKHLTPGSSQTSDPWQRTRFRTPKLNDSEGRERHIMKAIESKSCVFFLCLGGWVNIGDINT